MEDGKGKEKKMKVMIAIDGSECSHYALQWAIVNLHETIASSELFIFTVQTVTDFIYANVSTHGFPHPDLTKAILEDKKKAASALLDQAKCICVEHGIVAQTVTDIGDPKEKICEAAEKINVQLLILGSHSRGAIKRAFLGSVSNQCVHNAKCSVLVVKQRV
ncbi:hypothetical protein K2173_017066 [Erythroxylum novogranatense]|uniref:UspA domain-containing protein n=1 Tax=Erythroxylum novogranatense TaxID=1862640 RepID=A0AAV8U8F8_9ROSI|nr:hypothetical protein K2173_017066 [Erythroxylum novogranatense]